MKISDLPTLKKKKRKKEKSTPLQNNIYETIKMSMTIISLRDRYMLIRNT